MNEPKDKICFSVNHLNSLNSKKGFIVNNVVKEFEGTVTFGWTEAMAFV